ncbi:MAG: UvrD-helicase domain-containing protein [Methanocorpusculum sp.]|nr:UvrD-helicase domain-containing protein [Methanocorpusculum sp.]
MTTANTAEYAGIPRLRRWKMLTERQAEALDMERSVCVTAGAGTGKTFLLTRRYMSSLLAGAEPKDILALTYTDKAAAEMRVKIEKELREKAGVIPELAGALDGFARCTIATFHGFSASLIREFATEAGLDPGFSVMDDLDRYELVLSTIRELLEEPPEELFGDVVTLFHYASGSTVKKYIQYLLPKWRMAAGWFARLEKNPDGILAVWQTAWETRMREKTEAFVHDPDVCRAVEAYAAASGKCQLFSDAPGLFAALAKAEDARTAADIGRRLAALSARGITKAIPHDAHTVFMEKRGWYKTFPQYPDTDDLRTRVMLELLTSLGRVTARAAAAINAEKGRRGMLDFDDLIYYAGQLIRDETIREELNRRYAFILVDEVQDNDPVLTEMVNALCGDPKKSRKLFVVGDVKQSIYRFRGADSAGFVRLAEQFDRPPVNLDTCFRSVPQITEFVNQLFGGVFDAENGYDPQYADVTSGRPEGEAGSVSLIRCCFAEKTPAGEKCRTEAEHLASWIRAKIRDEEFFVYDGGGRRRAVAGDFAILMDKRTHMPELEAALNKYGIRFQEYKGRSFYRKQEVYDFSNLLKAVLYPEDPVPLYGALRSPYFGLSDADLCAGRMYGREGSFAKRFSLYAKAAGGAVLLADEQLRRWRTAVSQKLLREFLHDVVVESGILSVYAGIPHGAEMTANLEKLLDIARSKEAAGAFSCQRFLDVLDICIEEEIDEGEGEAESGAEDCVKILTVHAAKGLEYPVAAVVFSGLKHQRKNEPIVFDERFGAGVSVSLPDEVKKPDGLVQAFVRDEAEAAEKAERKRLFYVAATRARDHLVISGSAADGAGCGSFLEMLDGCGVPAGVLDAYEALPEAEPVVVQEAAGFEAEGEPADVPEEEGSMFAFPSGPKRRAIDEGLCLHAIFAGGDAHEVCVRYCLEDKEEEFREAYAAFLSSEVMQGVVSSWCELPLLTADGRTRVVDRLVRLEDGSFAVIVYKSGREVMQSREGMEEYRKQLTEYSEILSVVLGAACVPARLYFAGSRSVVRVR